MKTSSLGELPEISVLVVRITKHFLIWLAVVLAFVVCLAVTGSFKFVINIPVSWRSLPGIIFAGIVAPRFVIKRLYQLDPSVPDPELTSRMQALSLKVGAQANEVRIAESKHALKYAGAWVNYKKRVTYLARKTVEVLTPNEVDFLIAHELAHLNNARFAERKKGSTVTMIFVFAAMIALWAAMTLQLQSTILFRLMWYVLPAVGIIIAIWDGIPFDRRREHDADILALEATRDLEAGVSSLTKLTQHLEYPSERKKEGMLNSHPTTLKRIAVLENTAKKIGIG